MKEQVVISTWVTMYTAVEGEMGRRSKRKRERGLVKLD